MILLVLLVSALALPGQETGLEDPAVYQPGISMVLPGIAAAQTAGSAVTFAEGAAPFSLGVVLQNPGDIDSFESGSFAFT
ncbi:MAG: hypothetical protein ACYC4D_04280 [Thermoleophilia bacterium]